MLELLFFHSRGFAAFRFISHALQFSFCCFRHAKLEAQDNFKTAESQYKRANEKFAKLRSALEKLKEQADEEAPLCDEEGNELPLKAQLEELGVANTQEAEVALEEAEEKANSIIANPNVVRQYEEKKEEMELAQGQLDDLKEGKDAKEAQLNNKRKPWEDALTNSITKVDKLFSKYMAEFGFTGEVGLRKGPESGDTDGPFKDWGVEIKVSFRQGVKPQVLSAKVQSGGERSVSTVSETFRTLSLRCCSIGVSPYFDLTLFPLIIQPQSRFYTSWLYKR